MNAMQEYLEAYQWLEKIRNELPFELPSFSEKSPEYFTRMVEMVNEFKDDYTFESIGDMLKEKWISDPLEYLDVEPLLTPYSDCNSYEDIAYGLLEAGSYEDEGYYDEDKHNPELLKKLGAELSKYDCYLKRSEGFIQKNW